MADLSDKNRDATERAGEALDFILDDTSSVTAERRASSSAISVELKKEKILADEFTRLKSRVLFITNDVGVFTKDTAVAREYADLEEVFDEVHVLVIGRPGTLPASPDAVRLSSRVWAYPLAPKFFFSIPFKARAYAADELTFTDGFRPDLVVARDPFESAIAGVFIADTFERLLQVQIHSDEWLNEERFLARDKFNKWRLRFMRYALKRTDSIRVATEHLTNVIEPIAPKVKDIAVLPRYFKTRELLSLSRTPEKKLFKQFIFSMVAVGDLNASSTMFRVLDASRMALQTPTIGLVVIGEGPLIDQFRQRTVLLNISNQVVFLGKVNDYTEHLRSADLLIVTDTDAASDELVVKAAALGVPMVMARTQLREDLFVDGRDAYLCEPEATLEFTDKIRKFLNANALRLQFSENSREVVRTRIEEDPRMYRLAYRDTIEHMLYKASADEAGKAAAAAAVVSGPALVQMDGMVMRVPEDMR